MGETYEAAGVDIAAGEEAVQRIKDKVRSTFRPEVIGDIGGFGGLFAFASHRYRHPVLVSSTDGVGTKALIAQASGRFDTIGVDLVAMCVDDLVCQGAEPLFFLDYIAVGKLDPDHIEQLVEGVAEGCRQAGCALIGGEMAEHPGAMDPGEFDLVGFSVGVAERDQLITGDAREARRRDDRPAVARHPVQRLLAGPPRPAGAGPQAARRPRLRGRPPHAGRGAPDAVGHLRPGRPRPAAGGRRARRRPRHRRRPGRQPHPGPAQGRRRHRGPPTWEEPRIFGEIRRLGEIDQDEMRKVFNLGIGMVVVVPADEVYRALDVLRGAGQRAVEIGKVHKGTGQVHFTG